MPFAIPTPTNPFDVQPDEISGTTHGIVVGGQTVGEWKKQGAVEVWSFSHGYHWPNHFTLMPNVLPAPGGYNGSYPITSGVLTFTNNPPAQPGQTGIYKVHSATGLDAWVTMSFVPGNWSQPKDMYWYSPKKTGLIQQGGGYVINMSQGVQFDSVSEMPSMGSCYHFNEVFHQP